MEQHEGKGTKVSKSSVSQVAEIGSIIFVSQLDCSSLFPFGGTTTESSTLKKHDTNR